MTAAERKHWLQVDSRHKRTWTLQNFHCWCSVWQLAIVSHIFTGFYNNLEKMFTNLSAAFLLIVLEQIFVIKYYFSVLNLLIFASQTSVTVSFTWWTSLITVQRHYFRGVYHLNCSCPLLYKPDGWMNWLVCTSRGQVWSHPVIKTWRNFAAGYLSKQV